MLWNIHELQGENFTYRLPRQNTRVHRDMVDKEQTILPSNQQLPCGDATPADLESPAHFTEAGANLLSMGEMDCTLVRDRNMGTTSPGREPCHQDHPDFSQIRLIVKI